MPPGDRNHGAKPQDPWHFPTGGCGGIAEVLLEVVIKKKREILPILPLVMLLLVAGWGGRRGGMNPTLLPMEALRCSPTYWQI